MFKTLRTPTVFVLLSFALGGWLLAWYHTVQHDYGTVVRSNSIHVGRRTELRLLYAVFRNLSGVSFNDGSTFQVDLYRNSTVILVNGEYIAAPVYMKLDSGQKFTEDGQQIMAAGRIANNYSHEYFGLLATVAHRAKITASFSRVGKLPAIPENEQIHAEAGFNRTINRFTQGVYSATPKTTWNFKPLGLIHDCLFLLTIIAYLVSLTAMPRWTIWNRLTPAQRRRAKGQCPACAYELKGLSTTTCPECGAALPSPREP